MPGAGGLVVPITGEFSLVLPGRGRMPTIFARRTAIGGTKTGNIEYSNIEYRYLYYYILYWLF
jgi:hypothetical protein